MTTTIFMLLKWNCRSTAFIRAVLFRFMSHTQAQTHSLDGFVLKYSWSGANIAKVSLVLLHLNSSSYLPQMVMARCAHCSSLSFFCVLWIVSHSFLLSSLEAVNWLFLLCHTRTLAALFMLHLWLSHCRSSVSVYRRCPRCDRLVVAWVMDFN